MWKNIVRNILIALAILSGLALGFTNTDVNLDSLKFWQTSSTTSTTMPKVTTSSMTYGRFLDYLEMGWIKRVDLYDNSRNAIVEASSPELGNRPQYIRVEIPAGASQLIIKLKEYNVDFDAHAAENSNAIADTIGNILVPVAFIGGLILLFQNSENLPGGMGQGPMNLGKSPARFQRRPDTGVMFDDIAGIDEAKAEFEEIVSFFKTT